MTQFGGLLLSALSNGSGPIESRSWRGLANEMILTSDRTEHSAGVPHRDRSRPVFFSSLGREAGPMAEPAVEVASVEAPLPEPVVERPSRNRQIEEEVAPPQAMEGERVGTIEVEVLPPPVMKPKAKSLPVGVPVAEVAPAESTPPREGPSQWLKNLTAPKTAASVASDPAPDRAML